MPVKIIVGDSRERLRELADGSVHCCVTSPPYFGLRDYGTASWEGGDDSCDHRKMSYAPGRETPGGRGGSMPSSETVFRDRCGKCGATRIDRQMGLEPTPDEFVAGMVEVFREVRRVLRDDGTLWLNIGDSYSASSTGNIGDKVSLGGGKANQAAGFGRPDKSSLPGIKTKDLIGIPWMLAFALRGDGWYLRQDIIWSKPNPMPESVRDRCTKAHEYIFMLSKSPRYFYDAEAIRNPASDAMLQQVRDGYSGQDTKDFAAGGAQSASGTKARIIANARAKVDKQRGHGRRHAGFNDRWDQMERDGQIALGSNKRSVWEVATQPFSEAHFATFPPALIEPCILAGCPAGGTVLDPFFGAGTTGLVADRLGRSCIGIELNPEYAAIAERRLKDDAGMFAQVAAA